MSEIVIFTGPTIPKNQAQEILNATYLPPAAQGDLYKVYKSHKPKLIGLIDGYFESIPSVWHKEILYLMSEGVHVWGSSSMGALRAAELSAFGMTGIGKIYSYFKSGVLEDDDEVAIVHAPAEMNYLCLSEAMVNIRETFFSAAQDGIITVTEKDDLIKIAKSLYYKTRIYEIIIDRSNLSVIKKSRLKNWLVKGRIDQKREDAAMLLKSIAEINIYSLPSVKVAYHFENTAMWKNLVKSVCETEDRW